MLRLPEVPLEQTRFYREIMQQEFEKGIEQGIEQGEVKFFLRMLRKRFGELPPWVHEKLDGADISRLEQWGDRVWEAESLEVMFDENDH